MNVNFLNVFFSKYQQICVIAMNNILFFAIKLIELQILLCLHKKR